MADIFLKKKRDELKTNKKKIKSYSTVDSCYLKCIFITDIHIIVKTKEPYNIGEKIIKPCTFDIYLELFDNIHVSKFKNISLPNDYCS